MCDETIFLYLISLVSVVTWVL